VALEVTWTAFEPAQTIREHGVFHFLDASGLWCKSSFSRNGLAAFGTATGSIDGTEIPGTTDFAEVFSGRTRFTDSCR
jgi:hypothetical protein